MAFTIASNNGKIHYAINHFVCDTANDILDLPVDLIWVGSTAYIIENGDTYMFNGQKKWVKIARGAGGSGSGSAGKAATIQVGEVVTGAPGSEVTIVNSGDESAAIFDFSIPRGDPFRIKATYPTKQDMDDDYDNPDIAVGDLVAITDGVNNATVYVKGDQEFVFFLEFDEPVAIQGEPGAKGDKGDKGDKGEAFIYTDFTEEQLEDLKGDTGVGIASASIDNVTYYLTLTYTNGNSETIETSLRGPQGIQGPTGADGSSISAVESVEVEDPDNPGEYVPGMRVTLTDSNYYDFIIPAGPKGEDGEDGIGITNIVPKSDGTLEIYYGDSPDPVVTQPLKGDKGEKGDSFKYTDFTPEELAALKGADGAPGAPGERGPQGLQGPKGEGLTIKKVYEDQAAMLEDAGNPELESGDIVITKDDGKLYVYDATAETFTYIIDLTTIETIQGPQGPQGEAFTYSDFTPEQLAGLVGPQGADGATADGVTINQNGNLVVHLDNGETIVTDIIPDELWMRIRNPYGYGSMSMNRKDNTAIGDYSTTFGNGCEASGDYSFAQGLNSKADGNESIAMGYGARAQGDRSIVLGSGYATGTGAVVIGEYGDASGDFSLATAYQSHATGQGSHAEGAFSTASGQCSHSEGHSTEAKGQYSHVEGDANTAIGISSHAEGRGNYANGDNSHVEGMSTKTTGQGSHAEGNGTEAIGQGSHAEGSGSKSIGQNSHAEGAGTQSNGICSHSEGAGTNASGDYSHTEGGGTQVTGIYAHAEGEATIVTGKGSHAEGYHTNVSGNYSHAEGYTTSTEGAYSHAEGDSSKAIGNGSHAEGKNTKSIGNFSHTEGTNTQASGVNSHAEGIGTNALGTAQHVSGKYNLIDQETAETYAVMVGNGTQSEPSNAYTLDWEGNERISGQQYVYNNRPVVSFLNNILKNPFDITACLDGDYILQNQTIDKLPADIVSGRGKLLQKRTSHKGNIYYILTEFNTNNMWVGSYTESTKVMKWSRINSSGGGGGTSDVVITPVLQSGTEIASYAIDGVTGYLYGPALEDMTADQLSEVSTLTGATKFVTIDATTDKLTYTTLTDIITELNDEYMAKHNPVGTGTMSINRKDNTTIGSYSIAIGYDGEASGTGSVALGHSPVASGNFSCAIGSSNTASGTYSFATGQNSTASGTYSTAFGENATASGNSSFAANQNTTASGMYSAAFGETSTASGTYSFVEGDHNVAAGAGSHAEGRQTNAQGEAAHTEGYGTKTLGSFSHAEGCNTVASGALSHAEGYNTITYDECTHAEGYGTAVYGYGSHAEGTYSIAKGNYSHAEGGSTIAGAFAEGVPDPIPQYDSNSTYNYDDYCIYGYKIYQCLGDDITGPFDPEDWKTLHIGDISEESYAHAEGDTTIASGECSHAEGYHTQAIGQYSHTEGSTNIANGECDHVEGYNNTNNGTYTHMEGYGNTMAVGGGQYSSIGGYNNSVNSGMVAGHVSGIGHNIAACGAQGLSVFGTFSNPPALEQGGCANLLEIVGNGTAINNRSNARTLDKQGNEELAGNLTINGAPTANAHAATVGMLKTLLDNFAPAYDSTVSYSANDVVVYGYTLYKANDTTTGDWDATKWDKIRVTDLI